MITAPTPRASPSGFALGNGTVINDNSSVLWTRNVLLSAQMGERASVVLICIITSRFEL